MRIQVDHHLVPHVGPFGMMVHGFGDERYARHIAERADEILARKVAVQLAVDQIPTLGFGKQRCNLGFGKFFCRHVAFLRDRLAFSSVIMRCNCCASNSAGCVARAANCMIAAWSGSSLIARGNSTIVGVSPETKIRGVCHCSGGHKRSMLWRPQSGKCSGDRRAANVLATAERSTPQRDGERSEKENSRHPVWCRPDRRIECAIDAGEAGY